MKKRKLTMKAIGLITLGSLFVAIPAGAEGLTTGYFNWGGFNKTFSNGSQSSTIGLSSSQTSTPGTDKYQGSFYGNYNYQDPGLTSAGASGQTQVNTVTSAQIQVGQYSGPASQEESQTITVDVGQGQDLDTQSTLATVAQNLSQSTNSAGTMTQTQVGSVTNVQTQVETGGLDVQINETDASSYQNQEKAATGEESEGGSEEQPL